MRSAAAARAPVPQETLDRVTLPVIEAPYDPSSFRSPDRRVRGPVLWGGVVARLRSGELTGGPENGARVALNLDVPGRFLGKTVDLAPEIASSAGKTDAAVAPVQSRRRGPGRGVQMGEPIGPRQHSSRPRAARHGWRPAR
jgi:hypothetical protein